MKSYDDWQISEHSLPAGKINDLGGYDPKTPEQKKIFKKVDLITLPKEITGTNCVNCKWIKDVKDGKGYCYHPKIKTAVTKHNCCALWDHKKAIRNF